jgi:S-adenosylmethionine:tRNA ribosyltransferase-isomerase
MRTESLNYDLPGELIAQHPADVRSQSKLMVMSRADGAVSDKSFADVVDYLEPGDCVVFNDTKVLPARFFGERRTGAKLEGLLLTEDGAGKWQVMLKNAVRVKEGERIILLNKEKEPFCEAIAVERIGQGRWLIDVQADGAAEDILAKIGFAPLPPYIKRDGGGESSDVDIDRYQTVYARNTGAVAAPTAGLHFTDELLKTINAKGVRFAYVTLHVGAGTFKPVTADDLDDHEIHSERYELSQGNATVINDCVSAGGRVIAVGTTSVRTLETIARGKTVSACTGDTRLFIQPGYEYKIVDAMVTNFHLPKSTLLALVGAFASLDNVMAAYRHAIENRYRFFSYGDAMLII